MLGSLHAPIARLARQTNATFIGYYDGPFHAYEKTLLQRHSVASDLDAVKQLLRPRDRRALEIGAGFGRVAAEIAPSTDLYLAVEIAEAPAAELRARSLPNTSVIETDFRNVALGEKVNLALIGSLSVNLFDAAALDATFAKSLTLLVPGGAIILGVFDDSSVERFRSYDGRIGSGLEFDRFEDEDGEERVLCTCFDFDPVTSRFRQSYFVDLKGSRRHPRYVVSALTERIWRRSEIEVVAARAGLELESELPFRIGGGGADGLLAWMLRFQMQRSDGRAPSASA